jgi:hypothetical protein
MAGADLLLMPENFIEAYEGVYNAVTDGTIQESRIDESVLRILTLKIRQGLLKWIYNKLLLIFDNINCDRTYTGWCGPALLDTHHKKSCYSCKYSIILL